MLRGIKPKLTGESGSVGLEYPQLVSQIAHCVADDQLLVLVLRLEIVEGNFGCVLIGLEHSAKRGDLLALCGQKRLEFDDLFMEVGDLFVRLFLGS